MVSSFCCHELGFGFPMSKPLLETIIQQHENQNYCDEKAGIEIHGSPKKQKLISTPFTRCIEYVNNKEGYWNYNHMVLQMEDCVQVLKHLYPQFEYVFIFDHLNGHNRMKPNGLNLNKISVCYGGKQPTM